jgi:hypothetical protein
MSYSRDSTVDYKVDNDIPPGGSAKLLFWHKALYVLLTIIILASLVVIATQINANAALGAEKAALKATIEALNQLLEATPTP